METKLGPILKMTLPISTRLNWSVNFLCENKKYSIETPMFKCSDFFAILDVPSGRNVSLFLLDKFKVVLLERSLYTTAKLTDPSFNL